MSPRRRSCGGEWRTTGGGLLLCGVAVGLIDIDELLSMMNIVSGFHNHTRDLRQTSLQTDSLPLLLRLRQKPCPQKTDKYRKIWDPDQHLSDVLLFNNSSLARTNADSSFIEVTKECRCRKNDSTSLMMCMCKMFENRNILEQVARILRTLSLPIPRKQKLLTTRLLCLSPRWRGSRPVC